MFDLPKKCFVNKFIPKKVFYEKVGVSSKVKDEFVNLVDRITWLYKLSEDIIGITKTEEIEELNRMALFDGASKDYIEEEQDKEKLKKINDEIKQIKNCRKWRNVSNS